MNGKFTLPLESKETCITPVKIPGLHNGAFHFSKILIFFKQSRGRGVARNMWNLTQFSANAKNIKTFLNTYHSQKFFGIQKVDI